MKMAGLLIGLLGLLAGTVCADDGGSDSPFSLGAGARELSLGGAGVVVSDAATAPYWNPSNLASAQYLTAAGFYSRLFDSDVAYQYAGAAWPTLDMGTFGLGVFRLGVDGIEKRDDRNLMLGYISEQRLALYAAYGRMLGSYRLGVATHFEHHALADRSATSSPGISVAFGRTITPPFAWSPSVDVTVVLRNVVSPRLTLLDDAVKLPFRVDFGTRIELAPNHGDHSAGILMSAGASDGADVQTSVGAEYGFQDMLTLRGGWESGKLSCGAGFRAGPLTFDYALVDRDLGSVHMFSITTLIGSSADDRRMARDQRREQEFNRIMASRVKGQQEAMIHDLIAAGQAALASGALTDASISLDRALFLTRVSGGDTAAVAALATEAHNLRERRDRDRQLGQLVDSATAKFRQGDLLGARHYAGMALALDASSPAALDLIARTDQALEDAAAQERMVSNALFTLDSLVSLGKIEEAGALHRTIAPYASRYPGISGAGSRLRFEAWRAEAERAAGDGNYALAAQFADSVSLSFPDHGWPAIFRENMKKVNGDVAAVAPVKETTAPTKLSATIRKEAEASYLAGQQAFAQGDLSGAISHWELAHRLAPDYRSVRDYLLQAYKLSGIDYYGKNRLPEAIAVWEKALRMVPGNPEISNYIARTRGEMARLAEAGYGD